MNLLVENYGIEVGAVPIDTTGAIVAGDYVSLKNYSHLTVIIQQGAWAGGTPAVTLLQATDVANSAADEKALELDYYWTKTGLTGTAFTKTAVTADTFNLTATANTITVIEIDASDLDSDGGFDCARVAIASPGANADLICVTYILSGARFAQASPPNPKVD